MKKKIKLIVVLLIMAFSAHAQFFNFPLKSNNRPIVEEAIEGSIVSVEQYYVLLDTVTNQKMGRNGEEYFNIISYPGIITEEGVIVSSESNTPWNKDYDFNKYEGKFRPLLTKTLIKKDSQPIQINDTVSSRTDLSTLYIIPLLENKGVKVDPASGNKEGWIIWISKGSDGKITMTSFTKQINVTENRDKIEIEKPEELNDVEAGYYFSSKVTDPGQLTFSLCGIVENDDDNWYLIFPFEQQEEVVLTPVRMTSSVKENKKSKKK